MELKQQNTVFDYRTLRLLVGLIAFTLAPFVSLISANPLSSISASYHTESRDLFVGLLFIVSAFLWAYNGHTIWQSRTSKIASLAAVFVAVFPTTCPNCEINMKSIIHYSAAVILFAILAYFCIWPFRKKLKGQKGKKGIRNKIYLSCGIIMISCMLGLGILKLTLPLEILKKIKATYWAEAIALSAFGVAWIVAGKYIRIFVDEEDALKLLKNRKKRPHSKEFQPD